MSVPLPRTAEPDEPLEPGDAELIEAVRSGDLEAYGLLYRRHAGAASDLRPAADRVMGRGRRPGRRGVRQGAGHAAHRRRAGRGVPGLPADHPAQRVLRPDPPGQEARVVRRHVQARPGRALGGHRGRRVGEPPGRAGVPAAAGAVADGALAHGDRAGVAGRGRADAGAHAERGGGAGLPGARGVAAGVPAGAPGRRHCRGAPRDGEPARRLGTRRPDGPAAGQGGEAPCDLCGLPGAGQRAGARQLRAAERGGAAAARHRRGRRVPRRARRSRRRRRSGGHRRGRRQCRRRCRRAGRRHRRSHRRRRRGHRGRQGPQPVEQPPVGQWVAVDPLLGR